MVALLVENLQAGDSRPRFPPLRSGILPLDERVEPEGGIQVALDAVRVPYDEQHLGAGLFRRRVGSGLVEPNHAFVVACGESIKNRPYLGESSSRGWCRRT